MPSVDYEPADLEILARVEERHFWFRARRRIIVEALARYFPDARSYLEIGCGTGYNARKIAEAFPSWRVVASDALREGRPESRGVAFLQCDARQVPFENEFDVIGCYDVLEHIADHSAVLRQMWAACRPGGGILLSVPQHSWLWSAADERAHHHRR